MAGRPKKSSARPQERQNLVMLFFFPHEKLWKLPVKCDRRRRKGSDSEPNLSRPTMRTLAVACLVLCMRESSYALPSIQPSSLHMPISQSHLRLQEMNPRIGVEATRSRFAEPIDSRSIMRLKGGREIPIDMQIIHWWDTSTSARVLSSFLILLGIYVLPGIPKAEKNIHPQLRVQGRVGFVIALIGFALVLAGPKLEETWGWYSLGFSSVSNIVRDPYSKPNRRV
jgi:hypothetical protein